MLQQPARQLHVSSMPESAIERRDAVVRPRLRSITVIHVSSVFDQQGQNALDVILPPRGEPKILRIGKMQDGRTDPDDPGGGGRIPLNRSTHRFPIIGSHLKAEIVLR